MSRRDRLYCHPRTTPVYRQTKPTEGQRGKQRSVTVLDRHPGVGLLLAAAVSVAAAADSTSPSQTGSLSQSRGLSNAPPIAGDLPRGMYFARKAYVPKALPKFEGTRDKLPSPVFDEDPACVQMYWKAWELAFRNFYEPPPGSPFVSQFIDAAFNQNIFLWDTCFMTMFCNYGYPYVPGIGSSITSTAGNSRTVRSAARSTARLAWSSGMGQPRGPGADQPLGGADRRRPPHVQSPTWTGRRRNRRRT